MRFRIKSIITTGIAVFLMSCGSTTTVGQSKLKPKAFQEQITNTANPQIIDVRTPGEFSKGHIKNASNLNIYDADFNQKLDLLSKDDTIFVYCKAGGRSADAASRLNSKGFKNVIDLEGGFMKWEHEGLKVEGAPKKPTSSEYTVPSYDSITSSQSLVIVDFYAPWCGPCKRMAPYLKKMKSTYQEEQLKIVKIDTDKNPVLTQHFQISGIPLIKIYHDGKEVASQLGFVSEEEMMTLIKPYL